MWSTTALLVLLSLGVSTIIAADLNSDAEAQKFLDRVTRSISSKDPAVIAGLFHPGFVFNGCKGVYNKEKVVAMLSHLPAGTKFNSTLKYSEYVKNDQIRYTVEVTGFGEKPLVAEFFLGRGDQQLLGGSVPACSKTRRSVRDDTKATVEKFLARITRSVESKDQSIISGLFQPGFVFKGCKGSYDKTKIVGMLMQTPAGTKMDFTLKSTEDQGESIKYLVSFAGPNKAEIVAEFILNKKDQQLESGSIPSCQKKRLARADLNSDAEAQKFLDRVTRSISSKDPAVIAGLFHPGFVFNGCKGVYNKEKVVAMLSHLPAGTKFNSTLKYSEYVKNDQIRYTVEVTGFGEKPLIAEFFLGRGDQQLLGGSVPACSKTRRSVRDDTKATVEKFLARITRSVESKDQSIISGLFQPGFVFKGCKGSYDKTKIVGMLMQTPAGTKMDFTLKSVEDQGESIKYLVSFAGPNKAEIVAEFILNKKDQQLESGSIPSCQKKRSAYVPTAKEHIEAFMRNAKAVIRRYDSGAVAKLFDEDFTVQGCAGKYDKAASVAQIGRIDTENPFDYELLSANFVSGHSGLVEFTVKIYGIWDNFTAEFLYNIEKGNLLSGHYTSCNKKDSSRSARGFARGLY